MAVVVGYWAVTIRRLGGLWSVLPEYSYGWVVPVLCVLLFVERWRTRPMVNAPRRPQSARFATGILLLAALLFLLARAALETIPIWRFSAWVLALTTAVITWCVLWSAGGIRWVRHFFFPVAFFLLAVPWPDRFEGPFIQALTQLNAALTVEVVAFFKVAAVRMGNVILIEAGMVGVQEACSGIRSFQSTLMISLFLGELFRFSFWRRVAFAVLGAALAFTFNIVRTSFLVWTCNRDGLGAVDKFHDPAGWSILGASLVCLALIGWWLNRQQRAADGPRPGTVPQKMHQPALSAFPIVAVIVVGLSLAATEIGIRWWFSIHEKSRHELADWAVDFGKGEFAPRSLKITAEVKGMLNYDLGTGWEWQGGGAERWQAFSFVWDKPKTLAREIACTAAATGHQPELCFTKAGMQLRQIYGKRRYSANGVPLVFKVYEFADRNIPIFVFACTWERNTKQTTSEEDQLPGVASTSRGVRQAIRKFARGERGITDEVRVFKLGVWGPRTIDEADAAFQQQLNLLVHPKTSGTQG